MNPPLKMSRVALATASLAFSLIAVDIQPAHAQSNPSDAPSAGSVETPPVAPDVAVPNPAPPLDLPPPPAPPPMMVTPPPPAPPPPPPKATVSSKFSADLYGFVEFDSIFDSTQGLGEVSGNAVIAKKGSFAGNHHQLTYTARNSRLGFKLKGPESDLLRASAIIEMDFLGNQPPTVSEASLYTNATFRFRHMALKMETPVIDVLAGQYWQLFGWQSYFHPNTVEMQGVPGQVYSRATQVRLSHGFKSEPVTLELAVAAARPPQRAAVQPDLQGAARLMINDWKGLHTAGATGTAIDALTIAVSGVYRHFRVDEFAMSPVTTRGKDAGGISVDALVPVIPATADHKENALTLNGSYVRGTGISDLFTGLSGGIAFPALANPMMLATAPTYTPNIDAGLVTYNAAGDLHSIDWQAVLVGLQYYLPPSGSWWISTNYSQMDSHNIALYATGSMGPKVFKRSQWWDGNIFVDLNKAVRLGGEVAWFKQRFVDESTATNYRVQASAFYIF